MSDRQEWERDAVVWLAGRRIEAESAAPEELLDPRHARAMARFAAWRAEAHAELDASRFAERVRRAVTAGGRQVRRVARAPDIVRSGEPGPIAAMLVPARAAGAAPLAELGVAAGTGRELFDEPCESWVAVPEDLPPSRYVALRVVGDSMTPLLHSGDVVLVDLDAEVTAGAIAVARHPEHGSVVKRAVRVAGAWQLASLNPAYPPLHLPTGAGGLLGPVVLRWCAHEAADQRPKPRLAPHP